MVLQQRLDYGFNGYEALAIPRATRSTRRRAKCQRVEDNQMCAFDLLATVAGKLFSQDKENPAMASDTSAEKDQHEFVEEFQDAYKPVEDELCDKGNCDKIGFPHLSSEPNNHNSCLKEFPHPEINVQSGIASVGTSSRNSERFVAEKLVDGKSHNKSENFTFKNKLDSYGYPVVSCCKLDDDTRKVRGLGGNGKLSRYNDRIPCSSLSNGCDNLPVINRDDDENCSGCTHRSYPCTKTKSFRPMTCTDDRTIRKLLACKYQKVAQEPREDTPCNSDLKLAFHSKKKCYKRQRSQMNIPFKRRKQLNGMNQDVSGFSPGMCEDSGIPSVEGQNSALQCRRGAHVNIRIKSFRVPELFIEIPENATIGSLKRTVMDAITAAFGGGLHVGIILQGEKVGDDSKTLLQTGISHDNQLDSLGFTLEPNFSESLPPVCASHSPVIPRADMPHPLIRYPPGPAITPKRIQGSYDKLPERQVTSLVNLLESDHYSAPSPINSSADKGTIDSKALVTVPEMSKQELAVAPPVQKSKQTESLQRRIRRPFSVEEVEALVQAVEKLGTGRWRDVKLRAFDNANRRTYVDLKDKWKTLVHTARISPQQRRGEPVPQELLDRVLAAHAYWSQHNTKQNHKHPESSLLLNQGFSTPHGYVDEMIA